MLVMALRIWELYLLLVGIKMVQALWKTIWQPLKKLMELPYYPAISFLPKRNENTST